MTIELDFVRQLREAFGFIKPTRNKKGHSLGSGNSDPVRLAEIKRLRFEENLTLQEIANKYGISRERVRQMIGNSGAGYTKRKIKAFVSKNKDKTNEEISARLGVSESYLSQFRSDHRHVTKFVGNREVGARWEEIISNMLVENRIGNRLMPHSHAFDILLDNGKRVDVKSSSRPMNPPTSKSLPFYCFATGKKERGHYCDFFICVVIPTVDVFVIPFDAAPRDAIHLIHPPNKRVSKYLQFHNRFDLLK